MPDEITEVSATEDAAPMPRRNQRRRAPVHVARYANHANVTSSPFDIRLNFAEIVTDENDQYVFEDFASVIMSPQHAKALLVLLSNNVKRWENTFGQIDISRIMKQAGAEELAE